MIICGFIDGLVKLYSPSFKTVKSHNGSVIDFFLGK